MNYLENYKEDEFIKKLEEVLGFKLTNFQKRYILNKPNTNIMKELNKKKRQTGITTIYCVKQILEIEMVNLAHMEEISDSYTFTNDKNEALRYSKGFYRDYFMELRTKLLRNNFTVCKTYYRP